MTELSGFNRAIVEKRIEWTPELFSLRLNGAHLDFKAGQFTKLALHGEDGKVISRAYSLVNAPFASCDWLEFLIVANPQGQLSPKLQELQEGQTLYVGATAHGELIFDSIPKTTKDLWLISTGTGIGPFLSLLDDINMRPGCDNIVLVHGVRHEKDLVYRYLIDQLLTQYEGRLQYVPVISREAPQGVLHGRIPELIANGSLSSFSGVSMSPEHSFAMLCGNPDMIRDTSSVLQQQGLRKHRRREPGNFIFERYW